LLVRRFVHYKSHLLDIEQVCDGVDARVEHRILKHNLRHIAVRVILWYVHLEPGERGSATELLFVIMRMLPLPEDTLLVGTLADEEDSKPDERRPGRGQAVDSRQLLLQKQVELCHEAVL
jgi:hypothetical protein